MKRKHLSLMIISLAAAVILIMLWLEVFHLNSRKYESSVKMIQPLSEIDVPNKSALEKMDLLERHMHLLSSPPPLIQRKVDLSALGYMPVMPGIGEGSGDPNSGSTIPAHRVTMAFDGKMKRFCIIDSSLYPEGAILPDGATILKIESTRVLIAKESLRQWLSVVPLFEATVPNKS